MSKPIETLAPLISSVRLADVRLVESTCKGVDTTLGGSPEAQMCVNWSAKAILRATGRFQVYADLQALLKPSNPDAEGASVSARFELSYEHPEDLSINEGLLEQFARLNGVFNVWPYWREYVQSAFSRMGFPGVSLPLYRYGDMPAPDPEHASKPKR